MGLEWNLNLIQHWTSFWCKPVNPVSNELLITNNKLILSIHILDLNQIQRFTTFLCQPAKQVSN